MSFRWDSTGIDPDAVGDLLPENEWFPFKIYDTDELESKSGNPMVLVKAAVFNDPRHNDVTVWHYVTFIPKGKPGEGINVHFRKCIGVPFGGMDNVDADEWIGKSFMGKISHETYQGKKRHKIAEVSPMRVGSNGTSSDNQAAVAAQAPVNKDEDVPF